MASRNDPRRTPMRNPLEGVSPGNVPIIDINRPSHDPYVKDGKLAPKLFTPLGQMLVVQVIQDASGHSVEGEIIIPETSNWKTCVYAVVAAGPDCKHVKRGDYVLCSPEVQARVIRYAGTETLFLAEQQLFAYIDEVRERNERKAESNSSDATVVDSELD